MRYVVSWFVVLGLLSLWSLGVWAVHGAAVWTVTHAGSLSGSAPTFAEPTLPAWLAPWVPAGVGDAIASMVAAAGPLLQAALAAAPSLAGGLTVAAWIVWAIGAILLGLGGLALHALIAVGRRQDRRPFFGRPRVSAAA